MYTLFVTINLEQDSWSYHLLEIENPLNKIEKGSLKVIFEIDTFLYNSPSLSGVTSRGGSRNSLKGGVLGQNSSKGGGVRVQVRGNFHILTSKKNKNQPLKGGFKPPNPSPLDPLLTRCIRHLKHREIND